MKMKSKRILGLAAAVVIVELIGSIGTFFTLPAIGTWYATLAKPAFTPPNWIIGPAWTILFALMGIAAYLVWEKGVRKRLVREALGVFGTQLELNVLWPIAFFGLRSPLLGLVDISFLLLAILLTIWLFYKARKEAAYLLLPYLIWVAFATLLNLSVWMLN